MRFLLMVVGFLILMFVGTFVFLFTPIGNPIVAGIIESKIVENTKLNAKFQNFKLSWGQIDTTLVIDSNTIVLAGEYNLFAKSFDLTYKVNLDDMKSFSALLNKEIYGKLNLKGDIKGDLQTTKITGLSDIASSDTNFEVELKELYPSQITASIQNAKLSEILAMIGEKQYADATINIDTLIKDFDPNNLDGLVKAVLSNGKVNTALIKKEFDIDLPNTNFTLQADALMQENIEYNLDFDSNLARIFSNGQVNPKLLAVDAKYNINISELGLFAPIINYPLKGAIKANGSINGDEKSMDVILKSDIAKSDTLIKLNLKDFEANTINGKIINLDSKTLFSMLSLPSYIDSKIDIDLLVNSAKLGKLDGKIKTFINKASFVSKTIKDEFDIDLPINNKFEAIINTDLTQNLAKSNIDFKSTIANLSTKESIVNLEDISIKSDYSLNISDLNNLYFITNQKLIGSMIINGDIYKKDESLKVNANSKTLGGEFLMNMVNEDIKVELKSLEIGQILKMLDYQQFFLGKINGDINYNTLKESGKVNADFAGGHFAKNNLTTIIAGLTGIDILKETFSKATLNSTINKNIINTNLDMSSSVIDIKTQNALLDTQNQTIDALLEIQAAKLPLKAKISGKTNSPNISVEGQGAMVEKAKEKINKEVDRAIKKHLGDEGKNLLKGLFK